MLPLSSSARYFLFFLSGLAGLGYQMIWTQRFTTGLGHEAPALLGVVTAFFGGMSLGAWGWGARLRRSSRPARWFGGLELVIAVWAVFSIWLIPWANRAASSLLNVEPSAGRHWSIAFALPLLTLLPATSAMGATLPAMERLLLAASPDQRRVVGAAYAANTLGAVAGILLTTFWIAPVFGLRLATVVLAVGNAIAGIGGLCLGRERTVAESRKAARPKVSNASIPIDASFTRRRLRFSLFLTGFLGIGYELIGVRVLSQILENTVFTYALALASYLIGTAGGAAAYQRWGRQGDFKTVLSRLLLGIVSACFLGILCAGRAKFIYESSRALFGMGWRGTTAAEMLVASAVFLLPSALMGATFSHLAQCAARQQGLGWATALNTLGGAFAGLCLGVILFPQLGGKWTLALISFGYVGLVPRIRGWEWAGCALPALLLVLLPANLHFVDLAPGERVSEFHEGILASVAVVESRDGHRMLRVNNRFQMGSTAAKIPQSRQALIPLLLHRAPQRALFLGLGTGLTLGAAGSFADLQVDGVELVPEILEVMPRFAPENASPEKNPRFNIIAADARRFVRATDKHYDVIVADVFHPARDGAAFLYTREQFEAIRSRLSPDGVFCQWLPVYQFDPEMLRVVVRTFLDVFPEARAVWLHFNVDIPVLGLVGTLTSVRYAPNSIESRKGSADFSAKLKEASLKDSLNLYGTFAAGTESLRKFAGDALINTDDHPRLLFGAPRFAYQKAQPPSIPELLDQFRCDPAEFIEPAQSPETERWAQHLREFQSARDRYLRGLVHETENQFSLAVDDYLASAQTSLFFTPAYARLVSIISVLAQTSRGEARRLYERLLQAQPAQPLGQKLLGPLLEREK